MPEIRRETDYVRVDGFLHNHVIIATQLLSKFYRPFNKTPDQEEVLLRVKLKFSMVTEIIKIDLRCDGDHSLLWRRFNCLI